MTGTALKAAREKRGWSQVRLGAVLGITQTYVSLMENAKRSLPDSVARRAAEVLDVPATELPVELPGESHARPTNATLVSELAKLNYPGFAYLRKGKPTRNPAEFLLNALSLEAGEARVLEALPWVLLKFHELDVDWIVRATKLRDHQNRLGFVVTLAREVAERNQAFSRRRAALQALEQRLEPSRLVREDTLGRQEMSDRMRLWLREHRSDAARHWNLLTDLRAEHLPYASDNSGSLAQLPS